MSRFWDQHAQKIDVHRFRGNDQYLWQPEHYPYEKIVDYLERRSLRYLITLLGEDEVFGCVVKRTAGLTLSRDLLDSILEIDFLRQAGVNLPECRFVDIGAGYGRFTHRMLQLNPRAYAVCTDAVDVSRAVCEKYLSSRGMQRWSVADPKHLDFGTYDLAVNIHSWSECSAHEVEWWMRWLRKKRVPRLFVVPHHADFNCGDGAAERPAPEAGDFRSIIEEHGYSVRFSLDPHVDGGHYYLFGLEGT